MEGPGTLRPMMSDFDRQVVDVEDQYAEDTPVAGLREWASGLYPLEAATELLIRAGFAQSWRPWVAPCYPDGDQDRAHWHWIDFEAIPEMIGDMSGGQQRVLRLAASLGAGGVPVSLNDDLSGLDRRLSALVLAAFSHALGTHQSGGALFAWPEPA